MFESPWHTEFFFAFCLISLGLAKWVMEKTTFLAGCLFLYIMLWGSYCYYFPQFLVPGFGQLVQAQFSALAPGAMLWLLLTFMPFLVIQRNNFNYRRINLGFIFLGVLNCLIMLKGLNPSLNFKGLQLNEAQDGVLLACLLPLVGTMQSRLKWPIAALYVVTILLTKSSTAYLGLGIAVTVYLVMMFRRNLKSSFILVCIPLLISVALGFLLLGKADFLHDNGRYYKWQMFMSYWWDHVNHIFGSGPGTFFLYGPGIELAKNAQAQNVFVWLHNDWLHILFELGYVGLALTILVYAQALWRCRERGILLACLLTYGITALTQMPIHQPVSGFFGAFLLSVALRRE